MEKVELFGAWPSPFSYRVIWALEFKGIQYDHKEEDLTNKSSLLLEYNPVHKKIPVLVHNGKPICESLVILEYIEEAWPNNLYTLLPRDAYQRAIVRFWAKFAEDKDVTIWTLFRTTGEEQEKARKDCLEMLKTIEDHGLGNNKGNKFFGGERIGIADLAFGSIFHWLEVIEQVVEVKLLDSNTFPSLYKWFNNFKEDPIIKNNLPDQDQMFTFFKKVRETILATVI